MTKLKPQPRQQPLSKSIVSKSDHYPIFVRAGEGIKVIYPSVDNDDNDINGKEEYASQNQNKSLPLGIPIEFESPIFIGRILIRLKTIPSVPQDKAKHKEYFNGKKRYYQCTVQGQFKLGGIKFSDIYFGDIYSKPFKGTPKGYIAKAFKRFMEKLNPGMIYDIGNDKPKVLNPIGSVQEMSIDIPGKEPDITLPLDKIENTSLLRRDDNANDDDDDDDNVCETTISAEEDNGDIDIVFKSRLERRKYLSKSNIAQQYTFDTSKVYTFHYYDHTVDISNYQQDIGPGLFKIDLTRSLNGQPLSLSGIQMTGDDDDDDNENTEQEQVIKYMYRFEIWHDKIL